MARQSIGTSTVAYGLGVSPESRQIFRYGDYLIQFAILGTTSSDRLRYKISTDGGATWGSWVPIWTSSNTYRSTGYMDPDGNILFVFSAFSGTWSIFYVKLTWSGSGWSLGTTYSVASNLYGTGQNADQIVVTQDYLGNIWVGYIKRNNDFKILTNPNEDGSGSWTTNDPTANNCYGIGLLPVGSDIWAFYTASNKLTYKIYSSSWGTANDIVGSGITNDYLSNQYINSSNIWSLVRTSSGIKAYHYMGSWDSGTLISNNSSDQMMALGLTNSSDLICIWSDYDGTNYDLAYKLYQNESWGSQIDITNDAATDYYTGIANNQPAGKIQYSYFSGGTTIYFDEISLPVTTQQTINSDAKIKGTIQQNILSDTKVVKRYQNELYSNSNIKGTLQKIITSNAKISNKVIQTINSDAKISNRIQDNILSDAILSRRIQKTIISDTKIKGTIQDTLLSDTKLVNRSTPSINSDAVIKHLEAFEILSDGKIVNRIQEEVGSSSFIRGVKYFYGQLNARITTDKYFYSQLQVAYPTPVNVTNLVVNDPKTGESLNFSWTGTDTNRSYNIYKKIGASWIKQNNSPIYENFITVGELVEDVSYDFKVTAVSGDGSESSGVEITGIPTYDLTYRTSPIYAIYINGVQNTDLILDSIEQVFGPQYSTAQLHIVGNPSAITLNAERQVVVIFINGTIVFTGKLLKREDVWNASILQVKYTVLNNLYNYSTTCITKIANEPKGEVQETKGIGWIMSELGLPALFTNVQIPEPVNLIGSTKLNAMASLAEQAGGYKLYCSPYGGISYYRPGYALINRSYVIGKNILEKNLVTDLTNEINSVTAASEYAEFTKVRTVTNDVEGGLLLSVNPEKQENLVSFTTMKKPIPEKENTWMFEECSINRGVTPIEDNEVKYFSFKITIPGYSSKELSNVQVQALINQPSEVKEIAVATVTREGEAPIETNIEFSPSLLKNKRYINELGVTAAHPWWDKSTNPKHAIKAYGLTEPIWETITSEVYVDKEHRTAYIIVSPIPVQYSHNFKEDSVLIPYYNPDTNSTQNRELPVTYQEAEDDQVIAPIRVVFTYQGDRRTYTIGGGTPSKYILAGVTPKYKDEELCAIDEELDNEDDVDNTLTQKAEEEYFKANLPTQEGTMQILGDESINLNTKVNGLQVVRIQHSFSQGFSTTLDLSLPQSQYASSLYSQKNKENIKKEIDKRDVIIKSIEYDERALKHNFEAIKVTIKGNKKGAPQTSTATYA